MTLALLTALRNARQDEITAEIDAGTGAGLLRIYDATQPATGGTVTTLLSEHAFSDPSFPAAVAAAITANAVASDVALAASTATWFRVVDSDFNFVLDGTVGLVSSGADLEMNSVTFSVGLDVDINSVVWTDGSA